MDDYMKELLRRLKEAINASMSESEEVQKIIEAMDEHGHSVDAIKTTIRLKEKPADDKGELPKPLPKKHIWTAQDKKFLRARKIAV